MAPRVAIFSPLTEPWGGSEELWFATALALRARGCAVDVLRAGVATGQPRMRELAAAGVGVSAVGGRPGRLWHAAAALGGARAEPDPFRVQTAAAARRLVRRRPELVLVSQGSNLDGTHIARLCTRLRLPYAIVAHKATELDWPPDAARAQVAAAYTGACLVAFVSERNRRLHEEQIGVPLPHAAIVRNPVAAGADGPLPWPAGDGIRLACVGRLHVRDKGTDVLLRALAAPPWPQRPVTLTLAGDGPHRRGLERLAPPSVRFAGTVDVAALWRDHHALVLPSRAEGLPLALVEAMRCGRPAIATDVGGVGELLEDGVTGFLAAAAAEAPLLDALERAWERRADWPELGRAAARAAERWVSPDPGGELAERLLRAAAA